MNYFPFSELVGEDYFVFHPSHWDTNTGSHILFRKIATTRYQNPASKTILTIPNDLLHSTKVAFVKLPSRTS